MYSYLIRSYIGGISSRMISRTYCHVDISGLPWLNCKNFPELQTIPCREAGSLANFTHDATTKLSTINSQSSLVQFMTLVFKILKNFHHISERISLKNLQKMIRLF
uniref:Uncharacterized protein n=1 Tax=Ascaris lumbricoides TaxID=6252 RepID=A0A0M3HK09_ASCLU